MYDDSDDFRPDQARLGCLVMLIVAGLEIGGAWWFIQWLQS